jgi:galactokinase
MKKLAKKVKSEFESHFDGKPILIRSPGRVNLIGEHTDYNEGFVLPLAIDKCIVLAMAPNSTGQLRFFANDKDEYFETSLRKNLQKSDKGWPDYLLGVVDRLGKHGYQSGGFDCVFGGDIPIGGGLSSSAALESGVLFGLDKLFGWNISPVEMAKIAQEAENKFVGVQCGIMDQFISLNGKKNKAMKLDCRSLEYEFYPFDNDEIAIILCDTQVQHELASSEYNVRRRECEEGVERLKEYKPDIRSLRDVSLGFLKEHRQALNSTIAKRCKYVIEENNRVLQACEDLQRGDWQSFGRRMYGSHRGLRDEYEVSCRELDVLEAAAHGIDGVFGARMMGGGFGGCTINIVEKSFIQSFCDEIQHIYTEKTGQKIKIYKTKVSGGTHLLI